MTTKTETNYSLKWAPAKLEQLNGKLIKGLVRVDWAGRISSWPVKKFHGALGCNFRYQNKEKIYIVNTKNVSLDNFPEPAAPAVSLTRDKMVEEINSFMEVYALSTEAMAVYTNASPSAIYRVKQNSGIEDDHVRYIYENYKVVAEQADESWYKFPPKQHRSRQRLAESVAELCEAVGGKNSLSEETGVSVTTINRMLKGENVTTSTILSLCDTYEIEPYDLYQYSPGSTVSREDLLHEEPEAHTETYVEDTESVISAEDEAPQQDVHTLEARVPASNGAWVVAAVDVLPSGEKTFRMGVHTKSGRVATYADLDEEAALLVADVFTR